MSILGQVLWKAPGVFRVQQCHEASSFLFFLWYASWLSGLFPSPGRVVGKGERFVRIKSERQALSLGGQAQPWTFLGKISNRNQAKRSGPNQALLLWVLQSMLLCNLELRQLAVQLLDGLIVNDCNTNKHKCSLSMYSVLSTLYITSHLILQTYLIKWVLLLSPFFKWGY